MKLPQLATVTAISLASILSLQPQSHAGEYSYLAKSENYFEKHNLTKASDYIDVRSMLKYGYQYCQAYENGNVEKVFNTIDTVDEQMKQNYPDEVIGLFSDSHKVMAVVASSELCPQYQEKVNNYLGVSGGKQI